MRRRLLLIAGLALLLSGPLSRTGAAADTLSPLTITCPDNITVGNDPGKCGAVVNFAPTVAGAIPIYFVTCSPDSGTLFPVGATTVKCSVYDGIGRTASCGFLVTVRDTEPPVCTLGLSVASPYNYFDCINQSALTVVANSAGGTAWSGLNICFKDGDNCPFSPGHGLASERTDRSDGASLFAPYPDGTTGITLTVVDSAGNSSQCTASITVLPPFVRQASQVYVQYEVPTPGGPVELAGPAELQFDVSFPSIPPNPVIPPSPVRINAQINLHDVVATLGGVTYHATNNVEAQLTSNQLSPIASVPGQYKFEAQGKAALHSFTLAMPLNAVITAGAHASASFAPPQFVGP